MTDTPQDESPEVEDPDGPPEDPLAAIQSAIQNSVDDGSILTGFALVTEWIEQDGQQSFSVLHSPMPPWHLQGLLTWGRDAYLAHGGTPMIVEFDGDDFDDA